MSYYFISRVNIYCQKSLFCIWDYFKKYFFFKCSKIIKLSFVNCYAIPKDLTLNSIKTGVIWKKLKTTLNMSKMIL